MKRLVALFLCALMMLPTVNCCGGLETLRTKIIVTIADYTGAADAAADLVSARGELEVTYADEAFIIAEYEGDDAKLDRIMSDLAGEECIDYVERDGAIELLASSSDKYTATQYWLDNTGSYTKYLASGETEQKTAKADVDVDGPEGWAAYAELNSVEKHEVIVAVIDTGIDYKNAELENVMWVNEKEIPDNGIDDDGNGYVDDIYGWDFYNKDATVCHYAYDEDHEGLFASPYDNDNHGTHVAGIIAAEANNGIGIAGIASCADVKLMSLKVHGSEEREGTISDVVKAIRYADMMGAKVCNISWGAYNYYASFYTAIQRSNMLFVCAAGNDGKNNDEYPLYPASYDLDNIISVTTLNPNGKLHVNANYGATSVDVAAPAVDVFSTVVQSFAVMSGSSMATPQVSAIAAVLFTLGDGLYASTVKDVILNSVKPLDELDELMTHAGIPSLANAIKNSDSLERDTYAPVLDVDLIYKNGDLVIILFSDDVGSAGVNSVRYFIGRKNAEYFAGGTQGSVISGGKLTLSKGGIYSFYAHDHAGNYILKTLRIMDDVVAPAIDNIDITYDNKAGMFNVDAEVSDQQSGVRVVKYLKGAHDVSEFASSSIEALKQDEADMVHFTIAEEGTYTIYASDNRGNASVRLIRAYTRPVVSIDINREVKNLELGQSWTVKYDTVPEQTTDRLYFTSSDENIAKVSKNGRVKTVGIGECVITVTSSSGRTGECTVVVSDGEG